MIRGAAALVLCGALLAGCGITAADLPLPGGGVEGETYELTAEFADALNLPDGAHVRLVGGDVGRVRRIEARGFTAVVTMAVSQDVTLPVGTTAELRQATPLGDVFVALHPPGGTAPGTAVLRPGDTIGLADTTTAASVEDLLAALSALVNGGGLAQLQTIVRELNTATDGRADDTGHLFGQLTDTLATLNARTAEIDRVLAAAQRLTDTAIARRSTIDAAFADLTPAITVLADRTDELTRALTAAGQVSGTGDALLRRSGDDVRAILRDLGPVLDGFAATEATLGPSLRNLVALGRITEQATLGESLAAGGEIGVGSPVQLPGPRDRLPGPDDFADGTRSFTENLQQLFEALGGAR